MVVFGLLEYAVVLEEGLHFVNGLHGEGLIGILAREHKSTHQKVSSCLKLSEVGIPLMLIRRMILFGLLIEHSFCIIRLQERNLILAMRSLMTANGLQ